jgi:hypothetical protein
MIYRPFCSTLSSAFENVEQKMVWICSTFLGCSENVEQNGGGFASGFSATEKAGSKSLLHLPVVKSLMY